MSKLLILLLVVLLGYIVWKGVRRAVGARRDASSATDGERMVDCSQCGVHLPVSESLAVGDRYFCSEEHRRLFKP
jgi:uncharacterized protein